MSWSQLRALTDVSIFPECITCKLSTQVLTRLVKGALYKGFETNYNGNEPYYICHINRSVINHMGCPDDTYPFGLLSPEVLHCVSNRSSSSVLIFSFPLLFRTHCPFVAVTQAFPPLEDQ